MISIQVDADSFYQRYDKIVDGGRVSVEYHADIGEIIVITAPFRRTQQPQLSTSGNAFSVSGPSTLRSMTSQSSICAIGCGR